jgi:hypothetical protein
MSDKKPNVFPSTGGKPEEAQSIGSPNVTSREMEAAQEMLRRTQEQMKAREEALRASAELQSAPIEALSYEQLAQAKGMTGAPASPIAITEAPESNRLTNEVAELSTPKWDSPYDVIPLPSKGKTYRGVKSSIKVAYMTGSDENILTSANLLESGDFLKVLISRNLLEPNLKYEDLLIGDRNAIIIWLRGSSFGNMYPITVIDSKGVAEEIEFDLNDLKYIYMEKDPDENGYFDFKCPQSGDEIKFKYLTVGDEDSIEAMLEKDEANKSAVNHRSGYTLRKQIVSVNGNSDKSFISTYIDNMRLGDVRAFREYYNNNESGVDLKITVKTAGGEALQTFLPFNLNFFWVNS